MMIRLTLLLMVLLGMTACTQPAVPVWSGWLEADTVAIGCVGAGVITQVGVVRGQTVAVGQPLFTLDAAAEQAALDEALARLARGEAQLANLNKGRRPSELAALQAQLTQAQAAEALSRAQWQRQQALVREKFVSSDRSDEARMAHARDLAQIQGIKALLETARLSARSDEIKAAEADIKVAQAQVAQARWKLDQKSIKATVAGRVEEVLFSAGEWLGNGQPAVVILPNNALKARFFVAETDLARLRMGQIVALSCDHCVGHLQANLDFVASQPEYTPPVIYSRENRATQVYRVEAHLSPAVAAGLHPGQPIEVSLPR